jgi:hypothetical protein
MRTGAQRAKALAAATLFACGGRTPLDAALPGEPSPADAAPSPPDSAVPPCNDGGPTELAYTLDAVGHIHRYDPRTGHADDLGAPSCGNSNVQWTMTASRDKAYIVYTDWTLFTVDLATLVCTQAPFSAGVFGDSGQFGVAVSGSGASERLFVYGLPSGSNVPVLAVADTTSFAMKQVGTVAPAPPPSSFPVNLTADLAGHLYAFSPGGLVQEIDPATARVVRSVDTGVTTMSTWATIVDGDGLFLWVGTRVVGYDLATHKRTSDRDVGIDSVGASSFLVCPGG